MQPLWQTSKKFSRHFRISTIFIGFQSKADHVANVGLVIRLWYFDLDPMTLILDRDLDILKLYMHTKIKFLGQGIQKLDSEQVRQTHRQTRLKI